MRMARRQIEEDPLYFDDPVFRVDPPSGEILPNSYYDFTVAFRPKTAGEVALTAYCEVTGREARLPLQLQGQGLGPKATWLYESLDVGDVYVNSEHRCVTDAVSAAALTICQPTCCLSPGPMRIPVQV